MHCKPAEYANLTEEEEMAADYSVLTSKQKKVYSAIETYIKSTGIPPTVREIGEIVGEKTPGAVQGILNRLEMKGVIKRQMGMARSIQIVAQDTQYAKHIYIPIIKKVTRRNADDVLNIYNIESYYPMPAQMFNDPENLFIIANPDRSVPESNSDREGYIVVRVADTFKDGDTVLALYENLALLREYHLESGSKSIFLKAEGSIVQKESFAPEEIILIGKLTARLILYK